jgi:serine O-acetyltransferase
VIKSIRSDLKRFHRSPEPLSFFGLLQLLWFSFGLQALIVYRFGRWVLTLRGCPIQDLLRFLLYPAYWLPSCYIRAAYGIDLDLSADIGPGLYIGHFGGVRVRQCRLGQMCAIQQNVTIGPSGGIGEGPVIGQRVGIGANSCLVGPIKVGDGATVGAGAVVKQHVKPKCLVLGKPARVAMIGYDNSPFL